MAQSSISRFQQHRAGPFVAPKVRRQPSLLHPRGASSSGSSSSDVARNPPHVAQTLSPSLNDASSSSSSRRDAPASSSAPKSSSTSPPASAAPPRRPSWLESNPSLARKVLAAADAAAVEELLQPEAEAGPSLGLAESDWHELLAAALDRGNKQLALSMHAAMRAARRPQASKASYDAGVDWPAAGIQSTCILVLGLCKQVAISEAVRVISDIRAPLTRNEEVGFGKVISSPLAPGRTLTVVQPQEGFKLVADAYSKYEYEVFSGTVITCSSEALQSQMNNPLFVLARTLGLQRSLPASAVHTMTLQAPDGSSRTFRFGTETANVPAQAGERVTAVCAPFKNSAKGRRAVFSASPPGRRPGEAMQATNHKTGVVTPLLQPPSSTAQSAFPSWFLPAVVLLAGSDAASSLIDPALPAMIALGSAVAVGSVVAGTSVLVPRLKQLSDRDVSLEYMRQQLLGQYARLAKKSDDISAESNEDIRILAKLWQLQTKMESVGHTAAAYEARISRIALARQNIEERLTKKLELLDGYARVMNMIEIEVEMDLEVPAAELEGIEQQIERLQELESLQDDWRVQAEARDEVERLLRAP